MKKQSLNEELIRMRTLAGLISENIEMLNEDYLELKSIVKYLYSFFKKEGFEVEILDVNSKKTQVRNGEHLVGTKDSKYLNNKGGTVMIQQISDKNANNFIAVTIPTYAVAHNFIANPSNRNYLEGLILKNRPNTKGMDIMFSELNNYESYIRNTAFGSDFSDIQNNPEIKKYADNLGEGLMNIIKSKKPNIQFVSKHMPYQYQMYFREPQTAKGGIANPNQRPNTHSTTTATT